LHPAWVGVLGALLYLPSLRHGLTRYDDPWLIRDNVLLQRVDWDALRRVFFDFSVEQRLRLGAEYLPIRDLSVMLDFAVWGDRFSGHHLTQVLLYGGLCALAATLVLELFAHRALAWWAGAAFALHPIHVEAVAWLSERKGVLGAFLFFGAAVLAVRYLRIGHSARLLGCLALFAASILSKGHMLAGGAALLMCALWCSSAPPKRRWLVGSGALAVGAAIFVPVFRAGQSVGMVQPYHGGGLLGTLLLFGELHGNYLRLMLLGGPYSIAYPVGPQAGGGALASAIGWVALIAFGFFAVRGLVGRERRDAASFGLGWWLLFLLPVSHLVFPLQNLMADRYLLVGSWGLLLVLAVGLVALPRRTSRIVGSCWLAVSLIWTVTQLGHWESSRTLRLHAVSVHPGDVESWNGLASDAQERGDHAQAERFVAEGLARSGDSEERWRLYHRRALLLNEEGRLDDAIRWMRIAARGARAHKAHANLGLLLARRGQLDEALTQVRKACQYEPHSAHNQRARGIVALEVGEIEEACEAFAKALALDPFDADNHFNVGLCELRQGNRAQSDVAFERARELQPDLANRIDEAKGAVMR
jgi:hypothetical protein